MDYIHLQSPKNWMNDPNGFIYYKGMYHMFYQHFPYAPVWGTMHWGHATSKDLVHWEHTDIAIYPSKHYDANGIFSGNALEKDGKLYLYYTGIRYPHMNPDNIHIPGNDILEACQALLISEDGISFDNQNGKQCILAPSTDDTLMSRANTRDPKVFEVNGIYYMILGSTENGEGKLIFFESENAIDFHFRASYQSRAFGSVLECPDLFELDGTYILLGAAMEYFDDGLANDAQEIYKLCSFEPKTCAFSWESESHFLDYGTDYYATQTTLDADGNRVLIGWMRMPQAKSDAKRGAWSGLMTIPRTLSVKNGHLYSIPHKNIVSQFLVELSVEDVPGLIITGADDIQLFGTDESVTDFRLSVNLQEHTTIDIGGYLITYENNRITADRTAVYPVGNYRYQSTTPELKDGHHIDIYVSDSIIETYVNHGEYVISHIIYR